MADVLRHDEEIGRGRVTFRPETQPCGDSTSGPERGTREAALARAGREILATLAPQGTGRSHPMAATNCDASSRKTSSRLPRLAYNRGSRRKLKARYRW